jgi:predicted ATPase/DNA-binding CsgD family transcriptional regulator
MSSASLLLQPQPTPLIGRARELQTICQRLTEKKTRLLTVIGPAGVGKTRLALAAAAQLTNHFPDGIVLVDLAPTRDSALVLPTLARALGVVDTGNGSLLDRICAYLRERTILVVLDNFEQVLPAAGQLPELLASCPDLQLLVTSRMPLRLRWEQILRLDPLPVPDLAALPPVDELAQIPSVALFLERAVARREDFRLTEALAPQLAQLTVGLDGLPLALELAAARMGVLSLTAVVARLHDRLQLLRWEAQDLPERQRSLEATVRWSYELLSAEEQRLFRHLGVFEGKVSVEAIASVLGEVVEDRVLDGLTSLAEKSLIQRGREEEGEENATTFGMLETMCEYARKQLVHAGEMETARRAHAHYFVALAERADLELRGRDQRTWYLRLEREQDNLRAALRWLLDYDGPHSISVQDWTLRLAGALGWFWQFRGYHSEGRRWLEEAIAHVTERQGVDPAVLIRVWVRAGALSTISADLDKARTHLQEALALAHQRHDSVGVAQALTWLGVCELHEGKPAAAESLLEDALGYARTAGEPSHAGMALLELGVAAWAQDNITKAGERYTEAIELLEPVGDMRLAGMAHFQLTFIAGKQDDLSGAMRHLRIGLETCIALQDRLLLNMGARMALNVLGDHNWTQDLARSARLVGAADAQRQATRASHAGWKGIPADQGLARLRERLAQGDWAVEYRAGQSMPFNEVAALALSVVEDLAHIQESSHPISSSGATSQTDGTPASSDSLLTERQMEVLCLVARGCSNKDIAQQLFISPSTVNYHLTAIFNRLGVDTRAQAVAVAAQQGLL